MKTEIKYFENVIFIVVLFFLVSCAAPNDSFDGTGSFIATEIMVSAEVTGVIESLDVREGQVLEKGQMVGLIDTTMLHLQKEKIIAQIQSMRQGLPDVQAQTRYFDQQIDLARIQLEHLEKEKNRLINLLTIEAATQKQLDDLTSQVEQARQQIEVLKNQKKAQISALSTQKSGQEAQSLPLIAQLNLLNEQIRRAYITNPTPGTVLATYAEEGEFTTAGKPLYRIADLHEIHLKAFIPGTKYPDLALHQKVTILTDDGKGGMYADTGTVTWISREAEFTPKTVQTRDERENLVYAIKITVPNTTGRYKIGMYGEVKL